VRLRRGILYTCDQDCRLPGTRGDSGDERESNTHPMSIGSVPRLAGTPPGGAVDRLGGVDGVRLTDVTRRHRHVCIPRELVFQMGAQADQVRGRVARPGPPAC